MCDVDLTMGEKEQGGARYKVKGAGAAGAGGCWGGAGVVADTLSKYSTDTGTVSTVTAKGHLHAGVA